MMNITQTQAQCFGIKFLMRDVCNKEVGRAFLYIMYNDLHDRPFGFMEDVHIDETVRGQGMGTQLVNKVIEMARIRKCYKLVATSRNSRPRVHEFYQRLGFVDHGKEFRIDF